jgi:hypothetical protein
MARATVARFSQCVSAIPGAMRRGPGYPGPSVVSSYAPSSGNSTASSAEMAWALLRWSRYRDVTAMEECPSSFEIWETGTPAASRLTA